MQLETSTHTDRFEVALSGRLTSADLGAFRELLSQIRLSGCTVVMFDLVNLHWIDSFGLGMLLLARDDAAKRNVKLVLRSPQGDVRSMLKLGRFDTIFDVHS